MDKHLGSRLLEFAILIWVSVSVGPWWLGVILYLAAWVVNLSATAFLKGKHGAQA